MNTPVISKNGYFAVIFSSKRNTDEQTAYKTMTEKMITMAKNQRGFLDFESVRDENGNGITISYWEFEEDIKAWRSDSEHQLAQQLGRSRWYDSFKIRICRIEREYEYIN